MKGNFHLFAIAIALIVGSASTAWAIAGISGIATQGKPVQPIDQIPVGLMDVLNDPARTVGWNSWFSECPNDVDHYAFVAKSTEDLNRILKNLAAVEAKGTGVILSLGKEYPAGGFSYLKKGNGVSAVLAFGKQPVINSWYSHLKDGEPGVKIFGVHRYTEPPKALPPTLTIYVENPAVDLRKLVIPAAIGVKASITKEEREKRKDDMVIEAIDSYLEKRQRAAELR